MSKQTQRGLNPSSQQANRENSENTDENEREAFLTHSTTPVGERKRGRRHQQKEDDIETIDTPPNPQNTSSGNGSYSPSTAPTVSSSTTMAATAIEPLSIAPPAIIMAGNVGSSSSSSSPCAVPQQQHQQPMSSQEPTYTKWSTIGHQISFLASGIFSTIAVQWLNYQGAASGTTMLTVFFNYIGMMSVGLVYALQTWHADRSQRRQAMASTAARGGHVEYDVLTSTDMNEMSELHDHDENDEDDQGVRDHIELVGKKINIGHGNIGKQVNVQAIRIEEERVQDEDDEDDEDDSDDGTDVEKQRLRMKSLRKTKTKTTTTTTATTTTTTETMKNTKRKKDLSVSSSAAGGSSETENQTSRGLHWPVIQVAIMDVVANALVTVGFFYVGSGMYQVIYSSIVIWCAILTRIFLSRKLNNIQWLAIVGVTLGLAISAVGTVQDVSPDGPVQSWLEKSFGALVTLGATFLYACVYVLSDKVLSTFKPKPIPEKVCSMVGSYGSLLTFIYLCVYTFPNWQTEVSDLVQDRDGDWVGIVLVYPLVTISSMLHSLNYYVLISRINSVAVGIMQSLRAVLVFVMSHYLFCGTSTTQCFNQWKF
ncbi:hypothetical protein BGZ65_005711, partial [Modicella reniformis]